VAGPVKSAPGGVNPQVEGGCPGVARGSAAERDAGHFTPVRGPGGAGKSSGSRRFDLIADSCDVDIIRQLKNSLDDDFHTETVVGHWE
jgi:hypothetical protein